jgi:hypothetical protein
MFNVYADFREDIEQIRRDDKTYYMDFCKLLESLRAIETEKGGASDCPSRVEIREFWEDEAYGWQPGSPIKKRKRAKKSGARAAEPPRKS